MNPSADVFAPVLVVGAGRSGTTLLAELLARHSQVAIPPETQFFVGLRNLKIDPAQSRSPQELRQLLASLKRLAEAELDSDQLIQSLGAQPCTPADLFRAALELFTANSGKSRPGEKTPGHLFHVPTLVKHFPHCRIVGIVRDPRDVAASYANVEFGPQTALEAAAYWRYCAQRTLEHARAFPRHFMYIRYEDLLTDTETQLRRVDSFLGLPFEAGQFDHTIATGVLIERERQWKGKVKQPIDPSRAFAWEREMDGPTALQITSMARPLLQAFGYSDHPWRQLSWKERRRSRREAEAAWPLTLNTINGRFLHEPLSAPKSPNPWARARRSLLKLSSLGASARRMLLKAPFVWRFIN